MMTPIESYRPWCKTS